MNPLILDIETRPDPLISTSEEWWLHRASKVKPDGRLSDPGKMAAHATGKLDEERSKMALDPATGIIVCIGFQSWRDDEPQVLVADQANREGELALLRRWQFLMPEHRDVLVTFNGRRFDVPFVLARAMVHGLALKWWPKPRDYRYHVDLYDDLGLDRPQEDWQFVMGGGFNTVSGKQILELPLDELAAKCKQDVGTLMAMAQRTAFSWMPQGGAL